MPTLLAHNLSFPWQAQYFSSWIMLVYDLSFLLCDQEGRRGKIQKGLKLFCKSSASFEDSALSSTKRQERLYLSTKGTGPLV